MGDERIEIEKPQGHHCFACGTDNPIRLNLQFYRAGEVVCSEITLKKVHEGWEGIGHGGIVTILLDEVMSWSLMYAKRAFLVTRSIQIKSRSNPDQIHQARPHRDVPEGHRLAC